MDEFENVDLILEELKEEIEATGDLKAKLEYAYYAQTADLSEDNRQLMQKWLSDCIEADYEPIWSRFYLVSSLRYPAKNKDPRIITLYEEMLNSEDCPNEDFAAMMCQDLGRCYSEGIVTDTDFEKAYSYFKRGIETAPMTDNYISIGDCYMNGWNVNIDKKKAFSFYDQALKIAYEYPDVITNRDASRAFALGRIGRCYLNGWGVDQDIEKAIEYLEDSIDIFDQGEHDTSVADDLARARSMMKVREDGEQ